jgi:uncharacterized protein
MLIFTFFGCGSDSLLFKERPISAIDMHLHIGLWDQIPDATQSELASRFPFPFGLKPEALADQVLTGEGIIDELDNAFLDAGFLFAVYAPRSVGVATNEYVLSQLKTNPKRLYGIASLQVDDWANQKYQQLDALSMALETDGMIGVKIAHPHQHFRMDDPDYFDIYTVAAEFNAPVYIHTGPSPFINTNTDAPYTDPAYLETAIIENPDTTFILGHLGYDFINKNHLHLETCINLAQTYPNVWLEPSALGSSGSDPNGTNLTEAMAAIKEADLINKTIYGSDGPQRPGFAKDYAERTLLSMENAGYSFDEAQLVMSGNSEQLFLREEP